MAGHRNTNTNFLLHIIYLKRLQFDTNCYAGAMNAPGLIRNMHSIDELAHYRNTRERAMSKSNRNQVFEKRDEWILALVAMVIPVTTIFSMI